MPTYYEYDGTEGNIDFVSNVDYEIRLSICNKCPHKSEGNDIICDICGCILNEYAKQRNAECPTHKWPEPSPVPEESLNKWISE